MTEGDIKRCNFKQTIDKLVQEALVGMANSFSRRIKLTSILLILFCCAFCQTAKKGEPTPNHRSVHSLEVYIQKGPDGIARAYLVDSLQQLSLTEHKERPEDRSQSVEKPVAAAIGAIAIATFLGVQIFSKNSGLFSAGSKPRAHELPGRSIDAAGEALLKQKVKDGKLLLQDADLVRQLAQKTASEISITDVRYKGKPIDEAHRFSGQDSTGPDVYRFDFREPEEIFRDGFVGYWWTPGVERGVPASRKQGVLPTVDADGHQSGRELTFPVSHEYLKNSIFISTSLNPSKMGGGTLPDGVMNRSYAIDLKGIVGVRLDGVDEVAVPAYIPSENIIGVYQPKFVGAEYVPEFIPNPFYKGDKVDPRSRRSQERSSKSMKNPPTLFIQYSITS